MGGVASPKQAKRSVYVKWQEGDPAPEGYEIASDNLPARKSGSWSREKLDFLHRYVGPAMQATKRKGGHTHYIDLFAGPGRNIVIDKNTRRVIDEFEGSSIIALRSEFPSKAGPLKFRNFHFCNISELDHEVLRIRTGRALEAIGDSVDPENVHLYHGDSNEQVAEVLDGISGWAYLFVFVDIEGPSDLAFETIRVLRSRHSSVDCYVLFPTGFIDRVLEYDPEELEKRKDMWDRFFGTTIWLKIVRQRYTTSQARKMRSELLRLYQDQLRTVWKRADVVMAITKGDGHRVLYHMVFAHDHPAASSIFSWARGKLAQLDLFGRSIGMPLGRHGIE
jgi:three-Cys-motif partner protein